MEETGQLQRARLHRLLLVGCGLGLHLGLCWFVYHLSNLPLSAVQISLLLSLGIGGWIAFLLVNYLEWNLLFEEPDLRLPQLIWVLALVIPTAVYATDMRSLVLLSGLALLIACAGRLSRTEYIAFCVIAPALYGSGLLLSPAGSEGLNLEAWLSWLVFSVAVVFSPLLYRVEWGLLDWVLHEQDRQLKAVMETLDRETVRDALTGARNERYLMEILHHHKAMADRRHYIFSVCAVDLDHFHLVNERHGRNQGDEALVAVVAHLQSSLRQVDVVARIRDNRLTLVFSGAGEQDTASSLHRILAGLQDLIPLGDLKLTASVGVTQYRLHESVDALLERADQALYDAKRLGRDRLVVAPNMANTSAA